MQSRGRGPEPGEGAPGDFSVESQGWDFAGQAQPLQLRRIPRLCPWCAQAAQGRQRLRKVAEQGRPRARKVLGLRAGSGLEEACLRSLDPGALRPRVL
ncbi:hypothetical protein NN561_010889 [Cricetulus griseus]